MKSRRLVPLALAAVAILAAPLGSAATATLVWSDDFTGPSGAPPDPSRWHIDDGGSEYGDLEIYRNSPANLGLTGHGQLRITARHDDTGEYSSARIMSLPRTFLPAPHTGLHVSVRVKAASGVGVGTSFWTWGEDVASWPANGEIDIAEVLGAQPAVVHTALQCPGAPCHDTAPPYGLGQLYTTPDGRPLSAGFHTFAVDWHRDPDAISWSVDGHHVITRTPADTGAGGWVFDQPQFLLIALRVGGPFVGAPHEATFPASALVDDITVHRTR
jgi:beta-glucanase (GH16 family)